MLDNLVGIYTPASRTLIMDMPRVTEHARESRDGRTPRSYRVTRTSFWRPAFAQEDRRRALREIVDNSGSALRRGRFYNLKWMQREVLK